MNRIVVIVILVLHFNLVFSQSDSSKSLINETMLHPGDAFTGYTFKKGEWAYNQALTPYPSWAWWGITDWVTAEVDLEAWLGGVPSFNFRFRLIKPEGWRPVIAYETMFQYLADERDQFHNLDNLQINRQGVSWYNHINMTWKLHNVWYLHVSFGATYAENISISNGDSLNYVGTEFKDLLSPDFSLGVDWRLEQWISLHSTFSYGSTFLYADNIPRKQQFTFAARVAPFINKKSGFLNTFRIEITLLYANFEDAKQSITGPIGFLYWQWDWSKANRRKRKGSM